MTFISIRSSFMHDGREKNEKKKEKKKTNEEANRRMKVLGKSFNNAEKERNLT